MKRDKAYWDDKLAKCVLDLRHILTELNHLDPELKVKMKEIAPQSFSPSDIWTAYVCMKLASSGRLIENEKENVVSFPISGM